MQSKKKKKILSNTIDETIQKIQFKKGRIFFRKEIQIKKNRIQDTSTKKKWGLVREKGGIFVYFLFILPWRYGRVERPGIANPFFPVQIQVLPDQQKNTKYLILFYWYIVFNRNSWGKKTHDIFKSVTSYFVYVILANWVASNRYLNNVIINV